MRIPSSICGVVGLKPSLGRIPQTVLEGRFYNWAYHGPITRTVADNALMLDVLAGASMTDPMTMPDATTPFRHAVDGDVRGWRVAYSDDLGIGPVDAEVAAICADAVACLRGARCARHARHPAVGEPRGGDVARHLGLRATPPSTTCWTGTRCAVTSTTA